ncbi:hypothetical protein [Serratia fonticola]
MSAWEELALSEEEYDTLDIEWQEDRGNSGEMAYSYYAYVPENTSEHILSRNRWVVGQRIEVSLNAFDEEFEPCPGCMDDPCRCAEIDRDMHEAVEKDDRQERRRS